MRRAGHSSAAPEDGGPLRLGIARTCYVRPCRAIEPEATDGSILVTGIQDRYANLVRPLPLGGAAAMRSGRDGRLAVTRALEDAAPWLAAPIEVIDRQLRLQLWAGRPWIRFAPLLLVGPPGCGKSHLARLIAEAGGLGHATLDLGGVSDNRTLEGTARGWNSAQPCFPAVTINRTRSANPVITLEEVDKAGGSARNGDPLATLLTMIEKSTARRYFDRCLMASIDLSHVNWILTANSVHRLPGPLRSRLRIIEVGAPSAGHFDAIVAGLMRGFASEWSITPAMLPDLEPQVMELLRNRFARHRSVRRTATEIEVALAAAIRGRPRSTQ